jgi:FlaA1/EpsC-like NDP-sugar epimerase
LPSTAADKQYQTQEKKYISSSKMSIPTFNPTHDPKDLTDKVIFITGGTAGLGSNSVLELAKHDPAHISSPERTKRAQMP